jgi:hypothetical protein
VLDLRLRLQQWSKICPVCPQRSVW